MMLLSDDMNTVFDNELNDMFSYWKNFRIKDLKDDLVIYTKQMDSQKNIQNELNNQLKFLQKTLTSTNPQIFDKTSYNIILESFTNQLINLSNRIKITENLVYNLVKFFSNTINETDTQKVSESENTDKEEKEETNVNEDYIFEDNDDENSQENLDIESNSKHEEFMSSYSDQNGPIYDISETQIPDMSTEDIAKKVKEYLQLSKIGQRTFAEGLLSMRQANFSSLLSHPLPWSELSKTYRDRFLIMYHWLNDPDRLSKLTGMPNSRRTIPSISHSSSKYSLSSTMQSGKISKLSQQKRKRVKLKSVQKDKLMDYFNKNQYPSNAEINRLSTEINLPSKKIYTWFSNQRHLAKANYP
ncbi:homeobox cut-like 2 [Brachionus plicatilis]|uniref:One cut domain family member n=1 Tax=Brachionus plicatilis TaxID=10195 RepID=A0A3M7SY74_BRAPC|nr:homeobox cut-like 2 [Brachionus plicatilis]